MAKELVTAVEIVPAASAKTPAQIAINSWFLKNEISDWERIAPWEKLTLLQVTPGVFIKTRDVGGKKLPYVSHLFAEKALNFVFNFNISTELIGGSKFESYEEEVNEWKNGKVVGKKKTTVYEASVTVKFTFMDGDRAIVRTVISGHKSYKNPATTKADCEKSAMSKAWTVVARTFGIGADIIPQEEKAYASLEKTKTPAKVEPETKKSFDMNTPSY
jgi:hypothetical protein